MKHLLQHLAILIAALFIGVGALHADMTEKTLLANGNTSNEPNAGTSYSISGTYVAGGGNVNCPLISDKGVKLRCQRQAGDLNNTIRIDVNEGFLITGVQGQAVSNYDTPCTLTAVYVDGDTEHNLLTTSCTFPAKGETATKFEVNGFEAKSYVDLVTDGGSAQVNFGAIISYKLPAMPDPDANDILYLYNSSYATYCGINKDPLYAAIADHLSTSGLDLVAYDMNGRSASDLDQVALARAIISTEANAGSNELGVALAEAATQVPMLNLKTFYFSSGRWGWGTAANPSAPTPTISIGAPGLALFEGLLMTDEGQADLFTPTTLSNLIQGASISGNDVETLAEVENYQAVFSRGDNFIHIGYSYDDISEINGNGKQLVLNVLDLLLAGKGFKTPRTQPRLVHMTINGAAVSSAFLGRLSGGETTETLYALPDAFPVVAAEATAGGTVEIQQATAATPKAVITLKDATGTELKTYVIHFNIKVKEAAEKHKFDFVVGVDGDINEAFAAIERFSGSGRYHVFIPDGTHRLTGNTTINIEESRTWNDSTGVDNRNYVGQQYNNAMTWIKKSNISLVGQSTSGTILYNEPLFCGISYTSTVELRNSAKDCYLQDLTLKNNYAYGRHDRGVAVAFYDRGTRSILKNVKLWSNQDTYTSAGDRCYYETSEICGTVDFICGSGNMWFERCNLTINNRSGNVITAPRTTESQAWGYVFNHCVIDRASGASSVKDGNWTLGRPWGASPAATYLHTTMKVKPSNAAWTKMTNDLVCRFHEFGSVDVNGNAISLSSRSISACNPAEGSDNPVLSAAEAALYTVEKVLGGEDGYDPTELTSQCNAPAVTAEGNLLTWDDDVYASCYVIFLDGEYLANQVETTFRATLPGKYTVRAANGRGGLGAASAPVEIATNGVNNISATTLTDDNKLYDLSGRPVQKHSRPGIYIQGNKTIIKN